MTRQLERGARARPLVASRSVGLVIWTVQFARTPLSADANESFLHLPDLVFHEAGHIIFLPFGRFMTVLGGSLLQVLIPVIAVVAFVRQEEPFGAAICAWWAGQNLVDLAPYIADARGAADGAARRPHRRRGRRPRLGIPPHPARRARISIARLGMTAYALGIIVMVGALAFAGRTILRNSE